MGKFVELIWRKKWLKLFFYLICLVFYLMIFNRKVVLEVDLYIGEYVRGFYDWDIFLCLIDRDRGVVLVYIFNVFYGWWMYL